MENNLPPQYPAPPPLIPPGYGPRRSSGSGWMVLSILLILVLGFVLSGKALFRMVSFLPGTGQDDVRETSHHLEEVTIENASASDKIAIVDVDGIITSQQLGRSGRNMSDLIQDELRVAAKDDAVKAVILKVDSPGGEVMASDTIAKALSDFQEKNNKPVVVSMGSLAASGGYYVSAPCQWIVANELTLTGSIGVIMHGINYRGLMDKVGLVPQTFKSGRFKDMLSGTKKPEEIDPEETKMIQDMIMETYGKFKQVVADGRKRAQDKNKGRGRTLATNWTDFADGRVLTGRQALELGFVDQLGTFETAVETTKKIAGISGRAHMIRYEEPFDISNMFHLFGKSDVKTIKIETGLEFPKLQAGRPYFLSTTLAF
jgi:protease-4